MGAAWGPPLTLQRTKSWGSLGGRGPQVARRRVTRHRQGAPAAAPAHPGDPRGHLRGPATPACLSHPLHPRGAPGAHRAPAEALLTQRADRGLPGAPLFSPHPRGPGHPTGRGAAASHRRPHPRTARKSGGCGRARQPCPSSSSPSQAREEEG